MNSQLKNKQKKHGTFEMLKSISVDIQRLETDFKQLVSKIQLFFVQFKLIFALMMEIFCRTVEAVVIKILFYFMDTISERPTSNTQSKTWSKTQDSGPTIFLYESFKSFKKYFEN